MEAVVSNFTLSISGQYLVTCDLRGKMSLFDLLEGELVNEFVVPEKNVSV